MSYQNQSDSDNLSIIVGPPGPENIINSVHNFAAKHDIPLDDAWTVYVKSKADYFIEPDDSGLSYFSEIFTDILKQDVTVSEYFLTHYINTFSADGQLLAKIKDISRREPYIAPAIIFHAKNILDSEGKPINIKLFNVLNRDILQSLMLLLWNVNWIHTSISHGYEKIKAK
ncbi:hypothetical protein N9505_05085 [Candidatus Thioglobus sp.]|nr:hypothetical protein [Candidatus Thioglobus sp.]